MKFGHLPISTRDIPWSSSLLKAAQSLIVGELSLVLVLAYPSLSYKLDQPQRCRELEMIATTRAP